MKTQQLNVSTKNKFSLMSFMEYSKDYSTIVEIILFTKICESVWNGAEKLRRGEHRMRKFEKKPKIL